MKLWSLVSAPFVLGALVAPCTLVVLLLVPLQSVAADWRVARHAVYKIGAKLQAGGSAVGSAVVVAPGKLITSCHTTRDASRVRLLHREGDLAATPAAANLRHDLCLLTAPEVRGPLVERVPSTQLQVGQPVTAIGFAEGYRPQIGEGRITALYALDGAYVIRTTALFARGASGGGLFDEHGRLVGILTFRATLDRELNYAVPVEWVERLLQARGPAIATDDRNAAFWEDGQGENEPVFLRAAWFERAGMWAELQATALDWTLSEPDNAEAWLALGRAKLELGVYKEAALALRNAVARNPEHARAWYSLAVAYRHIGFVQEFVYASVRVEHLDSHLAGDLHGRLESQSR